MTAKVLLDASTMTFPLYNARARAKGSGRRQGPGEIVCWRVDADRPEALARARARPREKEHRRRPALFATAEPTGKTR